MIEIYKLTRRHMDDNDELPRELKDIKVFSTCVGHGVGTIDFSEKVLEISEDEYANMLINASDYVKFKLGNLSKYFEIEIFPHHAKKLCQGLQDCKFKEILSSLEVGYLVVRK